MDVIFLSGSINGIARAGRLISDVILKTTIKSISASSRPVCSKSSMLTLHVCYPMPLNLLSWALRNAEIDANFKPSRETQQTWIFNVTMFKIT